MTSTYKTKGICAKEIKVNVEDGVLKAVEFVDGCDGNLKGIAKLVQGMEVAEVVRRLDGVLCGERGTSCPDQLAKALKLTM